MTGTKYNSVKAPKRNRRYVYLFLVGQLWRPLSGSRYRSLKTTRSDAKIYVTAQKY